MQLTADNARDLAEIATQIAAMTAALDARDYETWLTPFLADAVYSSITAANRAENGPALFTDFGIDGLKERIAFWLGLWQVHRGRTRHLLGTPNLVAEVDGALRVASPLLIARTGADGVTALHASGAYHDDWRKLDGRWRLAWRQVVVDCDVLPSNFTDPL